jgi:hypothetical protein
MLDTMFVNTYYCCVLDAMEVLSSAESVTSTRNVILSNVLLCLCLMARLQEVSKLHMPEYECVTRQ